MNARHFRKSGTILPETVSGMSLRDWFAGQALAATADAICQQIAKQEDATIAQAGAAMCYGVADAMLAEREREKDDA